MGCHLLLLPHGLKKVVSMASKIFILGGAKSGKSRLAEETAVGFGKDKVYLATAQPRDEEMDTRIKRHQQDRGKDWQTIEEPLQIAQVLLNTAYEDKVILLDCLTLWLSNALEHGLDVEAEGKKLGGL